MEINSYTISYFINSISSLCFGLFVYFKSNRTRVSLYWMQMCLFVFVWSVGLGVTVSVNSALYEPIGLFGARSANAFAMFIPPLFLRFVVGFLDMENREKKAVKWAFLSTLPLLCISFSPLFISHVGPVVNVKYYTKAGSLFWIYFIHFTFWVIYSHWIMSKYLKNPESIRKQQVRLLFLAGLIGFSGGIITFLPCFDVPFEPWQGKYVWLFSVIMFYAVLRHQMFDVNLILRRTVVFALIFVSTGAIIGTLAFLFQFVMASYIKINPAVLYGFTLFIVLLGFKPLDHWLTIWTDRFLFKKKYDYKKVIKDFSTLTVAILNQKELVELTEKTIKQVLNLDHVCLLINSEKESINGLTPSQVIPIQDNQKKWGNLLLGRKRSNELYTEDDIDLLSTLTGQLAIAFQNIQSLEESTRAQAQVQQASKMATVGILAASINHEIRNPLYVARGQLESYLMNIEREDYSLPEDVEAVKEEIASLMKNSIKQIDRATEIMRSLSNFSKPTADRSMENISVKREVNEVLKFIAHEFRYNETELEIDIPDNFPPLAINLSHFQGILFNLLFNALHAVKGKLKSKVIIRARKFQNNNINSDLNLKMDTMDKVLIEISDNGSGISPEHLPHIFDSFFTTKGEIGTGLGLYLTKKFVEENKGSIEIESQVSQGTTFRIFFPFIANTTASGV